MARRNAGHRSVEEKRRSLPIYQHYSLTPGKTKSHHPEAKCNHCLKEFVCGSKQRLIRHLRKCNNVTNSDQIIAETLNTLARNSTTGHLNHSILEASNLLPSQINHVHQSATQNIVGQIQQNAAVAAAVAASTTSSPTLITTANNNSNNNNNNNNNIIANISSNISNTSSSNNNNSHNGLLLNNSSSNNHNTSGSSANSSSKDFISGHHQQLAIATTSNGLLLDATTTASNTISAPQQQRRPQKRGRKPGSQTVNTSGPSIHVTTGLDGKTHFMPASQLPQTQLPVTPLITQVQNGRFNYHAATAASLTAASAAAAHASSAAHLACATSNQHHHHSTLIKVDPELIDKAYLKLVLTRNLPLSLCDTKEFQLWVKTFANDYKPPSSNDLIAQNLQHEAQAARQKVSNILVKAGKKTVNLELHSWPHNSRGHFWYAVVANIDYKRFLISVKDARNDSDETGKVLSCFIDECIKRVGSDRVNSLIFSGRPQNDPLAAKVQQNLYQSHPSIVTYYCWWHFTNSLCSDIIQHNQAFESLLRKSNLLIDFFLNRQTSLSHNLEKFGPFAGFSGPFSPRREDPRWYSHLVCYLFEYIKNNEAIIRTFGTDSNLSSNHQDISSDKNNNSPESVTQVDISDSLNNPSTQQQQQQQRVLDKEDAKFNEVKSIIMSHDFWANLNTALIYLKPIRDIVALTSLISNNVNQQQNNGVYNLFESQTHPSTPSIATHLANNTSMSDYMSWFLNYGKALLNNWKQSPDSYKYQLIACYLKRFGSAISGFKLLFAAYLLNPKHKGAYMTQEAKTAAIEAILNIASESMREEDGRTIFDQWNLYLVREEPYDVIYDESRATPLEWWLSIPCAESMRRVALRILRLKAFISSKLENLFSQLYNYEDELRRTLNSSTFEDVATLRYFYDYEDKVGQSVSQSTWTTHHAQSNVASSMANGGGDRSLVGQVHNDQANDLSNYNKIMPNGPNNDYSLNSNGDSVDGYQSDESRRQSDAAYRSVVDSSFVPNQINTEAESNGNNSLEILPGYNDFMRYIDFNVTGVQVVEEPIEKKKRKWTAQEILSKCQRQSATNNNNNDIKRG